jgi:hypothetical protein
MQNYHSYCEERLPHEVFTLVMTVLNPTWNLAFGTPKLRTRQHSTG